MNDIRALLWAICADVGFVTATVVIRLKLLGSQQFNLAYASGGKVLASGTVSGENVSFNVPQGFDPQTLAKLSLAAWRTVKDMTNAELEDYVAEVEPDAFGLSIQLNP